MKVVLIHHLQTDSGVSGTGTNMKLVIVRHGDPDYEHDTLTKTGWEEAELLSERLSKMHFDGIFCSPRGRARDTAAPTLQKLGREAVNCDWLQEFPAQIWRPDCPEHRQIVWDWLPQDWTAHPEFYDPDHWADNEVMREGHVGEQVSEVIRQFDALLAKWGYERNGRIYRAVRPSNDTLLFFCHFGLGSILLGHLIGVSPMVLWHGTAVAPTGVTTVATEERVRGTASFRILQLGDISHLYAAGREPSFSARFCECYDNADERHV